MSGLSAKDLIFDAVTMCNSELMKAVSLYILRVFHVREGGEPPMFVVDVECCGRGVALLSWCCVRWGLL